MDKSASVDFHYLDKACLKDEFSLPNIDMLVDAPAGCFMFSFIHDFCGYNQIEMDP